MSAVKAMCVAEAGKGVVIQGNMAFAVGCVRAGIHAADGYPGTPSTEVIDKGPLPGPGHDHRGLVRERGRGGGSGIRTYPGW